MKRRRFFETIYRGALSAGYVSAFGLPNGAQGHQVSAPEGRLPGTYLENYWMDTREGQWYRSYIRLDIPHTTVISPHELVVNFNEPVEAPPWVYIPPPDPGKYTRVEYQRIVEHT